MQRGSRAAAVLAALSAALSPADGRENAQLDWPAECAPSPPGEPRVGVGMFDAAHITYSATDMPAVEPHLIDDPGGRRYENVIDCRWLLRCSDDTRVPRVIFSAFATENSHDYVRVWDGSPLGDPSVHRIADLHGSRLPDPVVGFRSAMTVQFVSDGTEDRWSRGDHFEAAFDCTEGDPNAVAPSDTHRCTMEFHSVAGDSGAQQFPRGVLDLDDDCGRRHAGSHLASIHGWADQEHFES